MRPRLNAPRQARAWPAGAPCMGWRRPGPLTRRGPVAWRAGGPAASGVGPWAPGAPCQEKKADVQGVEDGEGRAGIEWAEAGLALPHPRCAPLRRRVCCFCVFLHLGLDRPDFPRFLLHLPWGALFARRWRNVWGSRLLSRGLQRRHTRPAPPKEGLNKNLGVKKAFGDERPPQAPTEQGGATQQRSQKPKAVSSKLAGMAKADGAS